MPGLSDGLFPARAADGLHLEHAGVPMRHPPVRVGRRAAPGRDRELHAAERFATYSAVIVAAVRRKLVDPAVTQHGTDLTVRRRGPLRQDLRYNLAGGGIHAYVQPAPGPVPGPAHAAAPAIRPCRRG